MGLFNRKGKMVANIERSNAFLKDFAIKIHGLMEFVREDEDLKKELNVLKDKFQFTNPSPRKEAKVNEKNIMKLYASLKELLKQDAYDSVQVVRLIREIGLEIDEINAKR